jgi:predicted AAA+ superfamily ATPase
MVAHFLENWKQYLMEEDYNYLIEYIENIKNNKINDKMIIFTGPSRTGKSYLIKEIKNYIGKENYGEYINPLEIFYNENIKKLWFLCGIDEISYKNHNNKALINLIKYKQSIIADTCRLENVNKELLDYCKIIKFDHVFA